MLLQRLARYALPLMAAIMPAVSHASEMQGSDLSIVWAIPFAGILLSIALVPLIFPDFACLGRSDDYSALARFRAS